MGKVEKQKVKQEVKCLELYDDILDQISDLAIMKHVSLEASALILVLNELRQLHYHADRLDAVLITKGESK